jgi:preprotein translocase subunit YajC
VDNVNVITQAISTLGFPIAMCAALFWYMIQQRKQHEEESEKWQQALNNNTAILTKLYEKLG